MKPEDIRKLLGGYATGTLTEEERRALFEAALTDQETFNELGGEQVLKDLLDDDAARTELLKALPVERAPSPAGSLWSRIGMPWRWALASGLAAAAVVTVILVRPTARAPEQAPVLVAKRQELPAQQVQPETKPPEPAAARVRKTEAKPAAVAAVPAPPTPPPAAAPTEAPAEEAAPSAKPEAPQITVTAQATPMQTASSEKSALLDKRQLDALALRGRETFGYLPILPGDAGLTSSDTSSRSQTSTIRYRLLLRNAEGNYSEVGLQTEFRADDLVRVVFEPQESGRLQVTAASTGAKPLLNIAATAGGVYNVDVPPGEQKLVVTFLQSGTAARVAGGSLAAARSAAQTAPSTNEIQIRRQSPPR